jgi:hypothetical protein
VTDNLTGGRGLVVVRPGEGVPMVRLNGEDTELIVGEADPRRVRGAAQRCPDGFASVPLHIHHEAEEAFLVLDLS